MMCTRRGYPSRGFVANMTLEPTIVRSTPPVGGASRVVFDAARAQLVGLEEELMLLDPVTLDLAPCAQQALARLQADTRFKPELPAAQIENVTVPRRTVAAAAADLRAGREDLLDALGGLALVAGA